MKNRKNKLSKFIKYTTLFLIFSTACLAYSFVEPYLIGEKVTIIRDSDIPDNFLGKKIVFIADVHHDQYFTRERIADVVKRANSQNPDIIILGGDYVYEDKKYVAPCFEELSALRAPLGVYGVTGNHDSATDYDLIVRHMEKAGIMPLENAALDIEIGKEKIRLGGVKTSHLKKSNAAPTTLGATEEDFVILVSHNPDFAEELNNNLVDLMISGHTHGGQVTFFGLWAPYIPSKYGHKYMKGIVETPYTTVLISNGVGNSFLPMRFFARPQIDIIILERE